MTDLIAATRADHVIPTCEEVFWLAEAAAREGWAGRLLAPPLSVLARCHSKWDFIRWAETLGIAVPETHLLDAPITPDALPFALADCVFKPEFSRFATHTRIAPAPRELARIRPTKAVRWVVQRRLAGEEVCSWAMLHRGEVTAFAAYRPRWRQGRAAAFMVEAVASPEARAITETLGAASGMTGQLALDLIRDEAGVLRPIECNPRSVSGLHLLDASADLARAVVEGAPCPEPQPGRLRHMAPAMALLGVPAALASGRLGDLAADWRASRDVIARDDGLRVLIGCLADAAGFTAGALKARRSPAGTTTADIEWDGAPMP